MLQWRFTVTDSGAIIRKMGKKKQGKQRRKLKKLYAKEQSGDLRQGRLTSPSFLGLQTLPEEIPTTSGGK